MNENVIKLTITIADELLGCEIKPMGEVAVRWDNLTEEDQKAVINALYRLYQLFLRKQHQ